MATIQAQQNQLAMLKLEVRAAWVKACEVENIPVDAKFVVFGNTTEAAAYNELMGMYLRARNILRKQLEKNRNNRERHAALSGMGLRRVRVNGETIYE